MSKYQTRQRKALLDYLGSRTDELLSAQEIGEALRAADVSLSAVYRNLAELEREGKVRRASKGSAREVYYQFTGAEACRGCLHLSCRKCGRTFHMRSAGAERLVRSVSESEGFEIDRSETVLYGLCGDCREPETR